MAKRKTIAEQQKEFDVKKWEDSQEQGRDTCGDYEFCGDCNKKLENPCIKAKNKHARTK